MCLCGGKASMSRGPAGIIFVRENFSKVEFLLGRERRWRLTPAIDGTYRSCYSKFVYTHAFGKYEPDDDMSVEDTAIREAKEEHPGLITPEIEHIIRNHSQFPNVVSIKRLNWKVDDRNLGQHGWFIVFDITNGPQLGHASSKDCPLPSMRWYPTHLLPNPLNYPAYTIIENILKSCVEN